MNSLKVICISTALLLGTFAHASSPTGKKLTLKDFVSMNVEVPSEAELKGDSGFVLVTYTVSEDGLIEVMDIEASEEVLKSYVLDHLNGKEVIGDGTPGAVKQFKINFIRQ